MGAREYDPRTARWLQRDPAGVAAGHPNLYRYCHNDPINRTDPDGIKPKSKAECDKLLDDIAKALNKAEKTLSTLTPEDAVGGHRHPRGTTKPLGHCEEAADQLNEAHKLWEEFSKGDCWQYYTDDPRPGALSKKTDHLGKQLESRIKRTVNALEEAVEKGQITPQQAIDVIKRLLPKVQRYGQELVNWLVGMVKKLATKIIKGKVPVVTLAFFAYNWYTGGFSRAATNAVNDVLWPISELWDD